MPGTPTRPLIDDTCTIAPRPGRRHVGERVLHRRKGATRLRPRVCSMAARGSSSAGSEATMAPAAFTRISGPPSSPATRPTSASTCAGVEQVAPDRQPADLVGQRREPVVPAGGDRHAGAGAGQGPGDGGPQAGRRAGHEGDPAVEVEQPERVGQVGVHRRIIPTSRQGRKVGVFPCPGPPCGVSNH